jgi:hypothetical protein
MDFACGINAVQGRHADIEQCKVGSQFAAKFDSLQSVRCLPNNIETLVFQNGTQTVPDNRVIVGE